MSSSCLAKSMAFAGSLLGLFIIIAAFLYGSSVVEERNSVTEYENAISHGETITELKIEEKYITYSGLYGTRHYCFTLIIGGGKEEIEVSSKTYNAYMAGDLISCVRIGNTILAKPVLE